MIGIPRQLESEFEGGLLKKAHPQWDPLGIQEMAAVLSRLLPQVRLSACSERESKEPIAFEKQGRLRKI